MSNYEPSEDVDTSDVDGKCDGNCGPDGSECDGDCAG